MTLRRAIQVLKLVAIAAILLIAIRALHQTLAGYHWSELLMDLKERGAPTLIVANMLALTGYGMMTGYDAVAFRYIEHTLPYRWIALASFTGYAINNSLGLSGVVGSALRYRFYRRWGVAGGDIARVFVFCTVTYWLGFVLLGGTVFLLWPPLAPSSLHLPFGSIRVLGMLLLVPAFSYFAWVLVRRKPLRLRKIEVRLPNRTIFVAQVAISMADWVIAGAVLHTILPTSDDVPFVTTLAIFLLAQIGGLISNVPGGLGVFEAIALVFLRPHFSAAEIVSSLLAFRGIYFLLPLMIALFLLAGHEAAIRAPVRR